MERGKHVYVQKPLVRTIWEARQLTRGGRQVQGRDPDGQPGLLQRRHPPVRRDDLVRRDRQRHRSPRLDAIVRSGRRASPRFPPPDPVPSTLDWDLWLGVAEERPFTAGGKTEPDRWGGYFYQPFNWRGFYDFGCGALGDMACHILGAPNMALHLGAPQRSVECIKKEGASPFMFPKASMIRFDFPARGNMPARQDVLVRRSEGKSEDRGRAGRRIARRPAAAARVAADRGAGARRRSARRRSAAPGAGVRDRRLRRHASSTTAEFDASMKAAPRSSCASRHPTAASSSATRA